MNNSIAGRFDDLPGVDVKFTEGGTMTETETVNFDTIGITDDIMFGSVFGIMEECKEFLERLLRIKIVELKVVEEQKSMRTKLAGKGIRIDVYARDVEGNSYDIEMQLTNTGELDLRSRYYHSEMDGYQIRKGQKYKNLKESIVIFVCAFDPFKDNRSIYTFETICRENTTIICNCSEPSKIQKKNATDACIQKLFSFEFYLADTPHLENVSFRGWL